MLKAFKSLLYLWLAKKTRLQHEIPTWMVISEVVFSNVNISCRGRVFWPTKGTGDSQHYEFLI